MTKHYDDYSIDGVSMKTYKVWLQTKDGTNTFIIGAENLDMAIRDAKKQLLDDNGGMPVRVIVASGQRV